MEYNDPQSFQRLTGLAIFTPTGQSGGINLGNIQMMKLDHNLKSIDDKASIRGRIQLRRRKYTDALPVYTIDINQFLTPNLELMLLGTKSAGDFVQSAATASTYTFTAAAGLWFFIPAYGVQNVTVRVGSTVKVIDQDYFLDNFNGLIGIPITPIGIQPGDTVVVTFDQQAFALDAYKAFTNLDRRGQLVIFAEDEQGPPAIEIWIMDVSLSCKKGADTDPTRFRTFQLEAAVIGEPDVRRRADVLHLSVGDDTFVWG